MKHFPLLSLFFLLSFGPAHAQDLSFEWVKQLGGSNSDFGNSVAVDLEGNVLTTGSFWEKADFDPGTGVAELASKGESDIFISKLDAAGNYIWAKSFGGSSKDEGEAVLSDEEGNVYVTGAFTGTVHFDHIALTATGKSDIFLVKLSKLGDIIWAKRMGGVESDRGNALSMDDHGNIYVTGTYSGKADFGNTTLSETRSSTFITKIDTSGIFKWTQSLSGTSSVMGTSIFADSDGNNYTTGSFAGTADFNPGNGTQLLTSKGSNDIFIVKLDPNGRFIWAGSMGGPYHDRGNSIAVDKSGNIYTTGSFLNVADFDPGVATYNLISVNSDDIFVSKLTPDGYFSWAINIGSSSGDYGNAITTDRYGDVYVGGYFTNPADFNPDTAETHILNSAGLADIFLLKLSGSGKMLWAKRMGGSVSDVANGIFLDKNGSLYATGYFGATADFDQGQATATLTTFGNTDIFVLKLSCLDTSLSVREATACNSFQLNEILYTESGVYTQRFQNAAGCDSVIKLDLTINKIEPPVIRVEGFELSTTLAYASYQWFLDNLPISGATNRILTVSENGKYSVAVSTAEGCTDTSEVYEVNNATGISFTPASDKRINVYPNPAQASVYFSAPAPLSIEIFTLDGRSVMRKSETKEIDVSELPDGIYFLHMTEKKTLSPAVRKLVIQR